MPKINKLSVQTIKKLTQFLLYAALPWPAVSLPSLCHAFPFSLAVPFPLSLSSLVFLSSAPLFVSELPLFSSLWQLWPPVSAALSHLAVAVSLPVLEHTVECIIHISSKTTKLLLFTRMQG